MSKKPFFKLKIHKNMLVILAQLVFLIIVIIGIYILYPKVNVNVNGDWVNFKSINGNVIMLSQNPDLSNPRYIELNKSENLSFNLDPGVYYYKADNGVIAGITNKIEIKSVVGMEINKSGNDSNLVNVGNVKINVTKKGGTMVGYIVLDPSDSQKINDSMNYTGRQATK